MKKNPFDFQIPLIANVMADLRKLGRSLLAASMGSGKTQMATEVIKKTIKKDPKAKILVLAHGQSVLRSQFYQRLVAEKTPGTVLVESIEDLKKPGNVYVTLPQTISRHVDKIPFFKMVAADEAHEFFMAPSVDGILAAAMPEQVLILTASHGRYNDGSYPITSVSMSELVDAGVLADFKTTLVASADEFRASDYGLSDELKKSTQIKNADKTLGLALKEALGGADAKTIGPSLLVAYNQANAKVLVKGLRMRGINATISTSDTDPDSAEIHAFKAGEYQALVVCGRAVLGFDYPAMQNVFDFSGSCNVDKIFQLAGRVCRKYPGVEKSFYKMAPPGPIFETMYAALHVGLALTKPEYFANYQGFYNKTPTPMPKGMGSKERGVGNGQSIRLPSISDIRGIFAETGQGVGSYAMTTVAQVKAVLSGFLWTEEALRQHLVEAKYTSLSDWSSRGMASYNAARRLGVRDKLGAEIGFAPTRTRWTEELIRKLLTEGNFKRRRDWTAASHASEQAAIRLGIFDKLIEEFNLIQEGNTNRITSSPRRRSVSRELVSVAGAIDSAATIAAFNNKIGDAMTAKSMAEAMEEKAAYMDSIDASLQASVLRRLSGKLRNADVLLLAGKKCNCVKCDRPLTNKRAQKRGIGDDCMEKLGLRRVV